MQLAAHLKGCVENAIEHTQDTALKGRRFESIEAQNTYLMHWEQKWAAQRVHGRAKRQVEEMFQQERAYLKALPLEAFRYFEVPSPQVPEFVVRGLAGASTAGRALNWQVYSKEPVLMVKSRFLWDHMWTPRAAGAFLRLLIAAD